MVGLIGFHGVDGGRFVSFGARLVWCGSRTVLDLLRDNGLQWARNELTKAVGSGVLIVDAELLERRDVVSELGFVLPDFVVAVEEANFLRIASYPCVRRVGELAC